MSLSIKVIIATGIFAIVAIAITSLSVRQAAATKQADGKILEAIVVSSTFDELEENAQSLSLGEEDLPDIVISGSTFKRHTKVTESVDKKHLEVQLEITEQKDRSKTQIFRTILYQD